MTAPDPEVLYDLNDEDIFVSLVVPPASLLALTGIELRGFERLDVIPIIEWKATRRKRTTTLANKAS